MSSDTRLSRAEIEAMVAQFQRAVQENPEGVKRAADALVEEIGNAIGMAIAAVAEGIRERLGNITPEQKAEIAAALDKTWADVAVARQNKQVEALAAQLRQGR